MAQRSIRKAVISAFGDPSNINVIDAIVEPPPAAHVQVRVLYCGFSGADVNMRLGTYPMQPKPPLTPGYSIVGELTDDDPNGSMKRGDLVACLTKYEGQAELVNLPIKHLIPVAKGADVRQTTALVLDWTTAYAMIHQTAKVKTGQRVFIHGLTGAVGHAALILAKLQGAEVHGTASEKNHQALKDLGVTPYTYANKEWIAKVKAIGGVDAVFDALSFSSWDESYEVLNSTGILVGYGANLNHLNGSGADSIVWAFLKFYARKMMGLWRGKTTTFYLISRDDADYAKNLKELMGMQRQGEIEIPIKRIFDLENIQDAHQSFGKLPGVGSILVRVSKDVP